jgi:hypothetical protein
MICQTTDGGFRIPDRLDVNDFFSYTKTDEEVSVICKQQAVKHPDIINLALNRKIIKVCGTFNLSATGIIAGISGVLAKNGIPIFTISTYNTDYILIEEKDLGLAVNELKREGYNINFK